MPWCPKCKNEYVKGVSTCVDCGCSLVESLDDIREPLTFGTEEEMRQLTGFLEYNQIGTARMKPAGEDGIFEVFVSSRDQKKAAGITAVFLQQKAAEKKGDGAEERTDEEGIWKEDAPEEELSDELLSADASLPDDMANAVHLGRMLHGADQKGVYEEASRKAEEFKSGAYTLLVVGILGLAVLGLLISGILPVRLNPATQLLMCLVMGAMFLLFIVMGVLSFRPYRIQASKAVRESSLKDELIRYCRENIRADEIDRRSQVLSEEAEELRYFKRTEEMKRCISENFLNLEEGYLDNFVDEIYPQIFTE